MLKLRRFSKEDWYGWAGASPFPNGEEPWIGEIKMITLGHDKGQEPHTCIILVSGEEPGWVEIDWSSDDGEKHHAWMVKGAAALNVMTKLMFMPDGFSIDHEWLKAMGFQETR